MILYVVVPCYNEEEVLDETARRLRHKLADLHARGEIAAESRIVFVDDGSSDRTWEIIAALHRQDKMFGGIRLSRNRGHQNALLAGLMTVKDCADAVISMDADLQDDIDAVDEMLTQFLAGCEIVYGVRSRRNTDTAFKRSTAEGYYKLMNRLGARLIYNHADYRLMSRRALEGLAQFGERNLFLRGIVPMIGYRSGFVYYERAERYAGKSKYSLGKMLALAASGVTATSVKPLRMVTVLGAFLLFFGLLSLLISVICWCAGVPAAVAVILSSIWAACGLLLSAIGIVGEYVGSIAMETKARPRYLVDTVLLERDDG
ncbi:MAG: glycosyltransferase family 2 protein [Oscillospiraceae bacterium]|nr:glycosyltransferase family 2 protein [Oscillospiraceae bacterium]